MNNNTVNNINPFVASTSCFESPFLFVIIQQTACTEKVLDVTKAMVMIIDNKRNL